MRCGAREKGLILVPSGAQCSALLCGREVPDFGQYAGDAIGALAAQRATVADALIAATLRDSVWELFEFYGEWMESRGGRRLYFVSCCINERRLDAMGSEDYFIPLLHR